MADSFVDLDTEGPVAVYGKYIVKTEHIDDFSEAVRQFVERVRAGKQPYMTSLDVFRHGNLFVSSSKFESAEAIRIAIRDTTSIFSRAFRDFLTEEPELKFFDTYSSSKPEA